MLKGKVCTNTDKVRTNILSVVDTSIESSFADEFWVTARE